MKRGSQNRQRRKLFWVATEGEQTEVQYLDVTFERRYANLKPLPNTKKGSENNPKALLKKIRDAQRRSGRESGDRFWIVIDRDPGSWSEQQLRHLVSEAARLGCRVAISNPCFELWLALHFSYCAPATAALARTKLQEHIPDYCKAITRDHGFQGRLDTAIQNARQLRVNEGNDVILHIGSDMWELAEDLKSHIRKNTI